VLEYLRVRFEKALCLFRQDGCQAGWKGRGKGVGDVLRGIRTYWGSGDGGPWGGPGKRRKGRLRPIRGNGGLDVGAQGRMRRFGGVSQKRAESLNWDADCLLWRLVREGYLEEKQQPR